MFTTELWASKFSVERRSLIGRGLLTKPRDLPRIRNARLEDGVSSFVVLHYGTNPAPHVKINDAVALGGVTSRWYRARDGGKRIVAHSAKSTAGEAQEEATALQDEFSIMEF